MCGRFTLRAPAKDVATLFDLDAVPDLSPRYNIAPTQQVAAVRLDESGQRRELVLLRWGLIPSWADAPKTGYSMINARAETVASKPAFRHAFKKRRCLIVADGFYEWKKENGHKQPYYIHRQDDQPFAFAGLWERWKGKEQAIESCSIIVTEPNAVLEPIHDRMPVIVSPEDFELWLDPQFEGPGKLQELLRPCPPEALEAYAVKTVVNNPRNELEQCVEPAEG